MNGHLRRALALLMSLAVALGVIPVTPALAVNDVYTGQALVGEYGYHAKVRVEVDENGDILSVSDNGTEPGALNQEYWNRALEGDVFAAYTGLESYLIENYEDTIDAVTGATASSKAVFQAVVSAMNGEAEEPDTLFDIDGDGVLKEYAGDAERVEIPSGVVELDEYSFSAKENVQTVVLPASVQYINTSAFQNCPVLTNFEVDAGNEWFYGEDGVIYEKGTDKLILFPCGRTGSYSVKDGVTALGDGAFFSTGLTSLRIPASVNSIGDGLIDLSENISEILVDDGNADYASADGMLCSKAMDTLLLVPSALSGEHTIPDSIRELGEGVFYGCTKLTKITLPDGLEEVPTLAFAGCSALREVVFPESITSIGDRAFAGCNSLRSFTVPKNVTRLGTYLFSNAANLAEIQTEPENSAYVSVDGVLFTADRKTLVQYPTGRAGDYTVPEGTVQLAAGFFYSAELIEAVTIPDSVTTFGSGDGTPLGSIVFGMYDYPANLRIIASESSAAAQYAESMSIDYAAPSASVEEEGTDYQAEPGRTIAKDTMVIAPPRQKDGGHTWDSIWFGTWQGEPLKYRVLDPEQANSGDPDGLFLLSENLLGTGDWGGVWYHNAEGDARSNAWQGSDARNWCQDFAGLSEADEVPDSLTAPELAAVLATDKDDGEYGTYPLYAASESILQGDRVFFPFGEELSRGRFGFSSAVDRAASYDGSDKDVYYWTRSPILHEYGITYSAGVVKRNGGLDTGVVDDMNTARPALNLSKSRIAFISAAENGKASGTGAETLTAVTDYNGGEWKLTLRADRRDVSVSDAVTSGGDVTFRYHGAAVGENEYLSAIVTDTSGGIQYYGRLLSLSGADSGAGTASVRLPDGFDPEEQTLYVFSEQYNGDKRTDLAGTLAEVSIEETPAAQWKDGVYTGTGQGFGGEIAVEVTITNGKIASVTSPSHAGESDWTARNVDELLTRIAAANSTDVDGVTGATLSSNGVKEAVRNALAKTVDNGGAFASGSGTAADPYVIETADQLTAFAAYVDSGETCAGQYVVLGSDVDLTGRDWNPIGAEGDYTADQSALFNGVFDGQGHIICGLACQSNVDGQANVGLFSALNTEAVVRNVRLENVSIAVTGTADGQRVRAGGIAGATVSNPRARTAVIDSCSVTGSVSVSTANAMGYAAGVVGQLNGGSAVLNCCANVTVSGSGTGMAGRPYVGGLTANNGNGSVIANCAVRGSLSSQGAEADGYIGGIAGMLTSTVENVWSAADVTFGGTAESNAGLLAGMMLTESASAYYASDAALSIGGSAVEARPYGGEDEAAAVTKAETASASFADTLNGSLYDTFKALDKEELPLRQWVYETGTVLPTGELWVNGTPDSGAFESGTGTRDDPYVIVTEEQLRAFASDLSDTLDYDGLFVTLGADIALTQGDWTPIGGSAYVFEGTFDGQGHTIRGLTLGSESEPAALDGDMVYFGLFGILGSHARVKNVHLMEAGVYGTAAANTRLGGIAGMLYASDDSMENYAGGVIDGCSVSGTLSLRQANGNAWVGGITAYQNRGAIVNCWTDVEISCVTASTDADRKYFAEAGGLVGLNNRGLTANCYVLGNVTAGADQSGGDQSEAVAGGLIGCNAGALSGSYFHGNLTALGTSSYTGVVSGWITGIGKAYHCFYNADREMTIDGTARTIVPVGTLVPGGKSDEGLVYTGGVIEKLEPYTTDSYAALANALNESFAAYPVDITGYGLASDALCQWISRDGTVTFMETAANAVYVQPDAEIITPERPVPQDGIWYGRDEEKTTVVKITVENGEVTNTEVLSGEHSGEGYEKALELAAVKASIGDATTYSNHEKSCN